MRIVSLIFAGIVFSSTSFAVQEVREETWGCHSLSADNYRVYVETVRGVGLIATVSDGPVIRQFLVKQKSQLGKRKLSRSV